MADRLDVQPLITIEVAIALPGCQEICTLEVPAGTTASEAVTESGLLGKYHDHLPAGAAPALGIFSRPLNGLVLPLPDAYVLAEHDRVEIYRPLETDPKQARLERAARARQGKNRK